MTQITTIHRMPEALSLSNGGAPLAGQSNRDQSDLPQIGHSGEETVSLLMAGIDPPKLLDLTDETFIMGEIDKLANKGLLGAVQGIMGREAMAAILA